MSKPQLWTKDFLINSITNLFLYLAFFLLIVTIASHAIENLQASPSEAGLATGVFIIGALTARIFTGRTIDQVGRKKTLYFGLFFFLGVTLTYFYVNTLTPFIFIRFLNGIGFGIAATATGTIAASIIPHHRRGEGIGYYSMSTALASAVGPFLGMYIDRHGSFSVIVMLVAVLLGISLISVFFLKVPEIKMTEEEKNAMKGFSINNFFETKAIPISFIGIFIGMAQSSILSFMAIYVRDVNLAEAGSFFFLFSSIAMLISRPFTGRWFDTRGENFVMYPTFLIFALGLAVISQSYQGWVLLVAGMLSAIGYGTFISSGQAIAIKMASLHRLGLATSTFYIFIDGGIGIGPFLLGFLIPMTGFRGLYIWMAVLVFCCSVLYYFLHGRKSAAQEIPVTVER